MAKLTAAKKKRLPKSAFAIPSKRLYPIHDLPHARAALAYSKRRNTRGSYATVRAKVLKRYPQLKKTNTRRRRRKRR